MPFPDSTHVQFAHTRTRTHACTQFAQKSYKVNVAQAIFGPSKEDNEKGETIFVELVKQALRSEVHELLPRQVRVLLVR